MLAERIAELASALQRLFGGRVKIFGMTLQRLADILDTGHGLIGALRHGIAMTADQLAGTLDPGGNLAKAADNAIGVIADGLGGAAQTVGGGFRAGPHRGDLFAKRFAGFLELARIAFETASRSRTCFSTDSWTDPARSDRRAAT